MNWLLREIDARGLTQKELADVAGMTETQFSNVVHGRRRITVDEADTIRRYLGYRLPGDTPRSVSVAGRVGAGAHVDLVDAYEKGDGLYHVACPPQLSPRGIVAVEVEGESMCPIYPPGTVLFYSRPTSDGVPIECIGRISVCEDETGKAWVKIVKPGVQEGTFSLISVNPEALPMHGVRLKWAALVRFDLPPEMVERVG